MSAKALTRGGKTVHVNDSDLVRPVCMNCKKSGNTRSLRVSFIADIPPNGRAYWVHPEPCI